VRVLRLRTFEKTFRGNAVKKEPARPIRHAGFTKGGSVFRISLSKGESERQKN
jgi:hypothetical protein